MPRDAVATSAASGAGTPGGAKWYALGVFFAVYTMVGVDRGIVAIMVEPLKREFALSDTQIGMLSGLAFAFFFGVASLPIGYLVDRFDRRRLLAATLALFSGLTLIAGWATSFAQLFVIRLGVGAGEAGGTPAMTSIIADYFPPERRASALSVYYLGSPAAKILVLIVGGWLTLNFGWRAVFWAAGALGLVLAALVLFTLREPPRSGGQAADGAAPPVFDTLKFIWSQPSLRHLLATTMMTSAVSSATLTWAVSFLIRSHGLNVGQAGIALAISYGVVGGLGTLASGPVVDSLARRDVRWRCWFLAGMQILAIPALASFALSSSLLVSLVGFAVWSVVQAALLSPIVSMCQSLVGTRMRGMVTAVYTFLAHFIGVAIGAQLVGFVSDLLRPAFGADSLRYGLLAQLALFVWAAAHFALASRTLERDVERAKLLL